MRINKIITLLLGVVFSQSQTALAEESWTPVNEIPSMEKQGANVTQNNQYLYLFGPGQSQLNYLDIRLTDNTTTSQTVM